ncbi:hypothetical protein [Sphingomonas sp. G-3-2-10]|uniref:hypothetical protein n=1 Tax=Sphingomonas sp. G-3-2-10 TaxID=2728838 RepID=UPI00146EFB8E|nr:hypothetical protein [Sphingomonas sp. G-3-2-10]NML05261.1 hypothetical protein [Sphingomonas sp. G-3-2-10]
MIRKGIVAAAAGWMAMTGMAAEAQSVAKRGAKPPCVSKQEASALVMLMLPGVIRGANQLCGTLLPKEAYLLNGGRTLGARFEQAAARSGPDADRAMARMMGIKDGKGVPGAAASMAPMGEMMIMSLQPKVDAQICTDIDQALLLLDPLPAENLTGLVVMLMEIGMKEDKNPPFTICPAGQ